MLGYQTLRCFEMLPHDSTEYISFGFDVSLIGANGLHLPSRVSHCAAVLRAVIPPGPLTVRKDWGTPGGGDPNNHIRGGLRQRWYQRGLLVRECVDQHRILPNHSLTPAKLL